MTLLTIFFLTALTATLLAAVAWASAKSLKKKPVRIVVEAKNPRTPSRRR